MEFKDDATAFDGKKKAQFDNKGRLNNAISTLIYGMLEKRRPHPLRPPDRRHQRGGQERSTSSWSR
jgi:phosphoribosylaminoimidazole-succinocarboxamide synthase